MPITQADLDARATAQRTQLQRDGGKNAGMAGREFISQLQTGLDVGDALAVRLLESRIRALDPMPYEDCLACDGEGTRPGEKVCSQCHGTGHQPQRPLDPAMLLLRRAILHLSARRRNGVQLR